MNTERQSHRTLFLALLFIAVVLLGLGFLYFHPASPMNNEPAPEPADEAPQVPAGWTTYADPAGRFSFSYPPAIGTTYVSLTDWPPALELSNEAFSCLEAGTETMSGGQTAATVLPGGQPACITIRSEGAAGSTYRMYAYAIPQAEGQAIFTFSLRYPQCLNYDDPQQTACKAEQERFDPDALIESVSRTLTVTR